MLTLPGPQGLKMGWEVSFTLESSLAHDSLTRDRLGFLWAIIADPGLASLSPASSPSLPHTPLAARATLVQAGS